MTRGVEVAVGLGGRGVSVDVAVAVGLGVTAMPVVAVSWAESKGVGEGASLRTVGVGEGIARGLVVGLITGEDLKAAIVGVGSALHASKVVANSRRETASPKVLPSPCLRLAAGWALSIGLVGFGPDWVWCLVAMDIWFTFQYKSCQRWSPPDPHWRSGR